MPTVENFIRLFDVEEKRASRLKKLANGRFDIAIIGGGIHGAFLALTAIQSGYSVLLLEKNDFAFGTSSRSSKLLHGGIRYLEQGNFRLVFEALRERELLLAMAPHITRPLRFLFPVMPPHTPPRWQLTIGMALYDLMARVAPHSSESHLPRHRYHDFSTDSRIPSEISAWGMSIRGAFSYSDAQVEDSRLVVETVMEAASRGAECFNYAKVDSVKRLADESTYLIAWSAEYPKTSGEIRARVVFNCSGPWLEDFSPAGHAPSDIVYSRGAHLLFDVPWSGEALILPTREKGRYYFILPYFAPGSESTLVGTTDHATSERPEDPQASPAEIDELLGYLRRDLPQSPLSRDRLYQTFCGIRVLKSHGKNLDRVSTLSRSHEWIDQQGFLSLYGGKYTTARSSAVKGVKLAAERYFGNRPTIAPLNPLPAAVGLDSGRLRSLLSARFPNSSEGGISRAVARFGGACEKLAGESSARTLCEAQFEYAIRHEFAVTADDLLRRRMIIALLPERMKSEYLAPLCASGA